MYSRCRIITQTNQHMLVLLHFTQLFRTQYIVFVLYLSFVQFLQYYYQRGCLYRLRALGERHNMDITAEGFQVSITRCRRDRLTCFDDGPSLLSIIHFIHSFQSWMWKGLSFLLPFLCAAYFFQLYNAYVLMRLSFHPDCDEWQVTQSVDRSRLGRSIAVHIQ